MPVSQWTPGRKGLVLHLWVEEEMMDLGLKAGADSHVNSD